MIKALFSSKHGDTKLFEHGKEKSAFGGTRSLGLGGIAILVLDISFTAILQLIAVFKTSGLTVFLRYFDLFHCLR